MKQASPTTQQLRQYCYFSCLSDSALEALSQRLSFAQYPAGTNILHEGEIGDSFYFINKGEVEVSKRTQFGGEGNNKTVLSLLGHGETFGEMALLTCSPRSATVTAKTDVTLFQLKKMDFEQIILKDSILSSKMKEKADGYAHFNQMKALEPFVHLQPDHIALLFDRLLEKKYKPGEDIITQGQKGDYYYIVKSGHVVVLKQIHEEEPKKVAILGEYNGFGEEALLTGSRRSATVRALEETTVWALSKADFDAVLKSAYLEEVFPEDVPEKSGPYLLLDVRTSMEFDDEHIPGAINIPLDELRQKYSRLDPASEYFVYCLGGVRSAVAAFLLKAHGFKAQSIKGGMNAWPGDLQFSSQGPCQIHFPSALKRNISRVKMLLRRVKKEIITISAI
jgi:CRP-like cAMP-binding protein/rhodanese-related sulfurtransferase